MNAAILVSNIGDNIKDLVKTAMKIVRVDTISHVLVECNGVKVFIKKDTTEEMALDEYEYRLHSWLNITPKEKNKRCHCGKKIDYSNSHCVQFSLCKDCAMDS